MLTIRDRLGREGRLLRPEAPPEDEDQTVTIELPDGTEAQLPAAWLRPGDGGYVLALSFDELDREARLPLLEEQLEVRKRTADDVVRVHKRVRRHEERLRQELAREDVEIERIPLEREVSEAPAVREEGDTLIVPLVEEQIVWHKRLVVREEVRIRKRRRTETTEVRVPLRQEEIELEHEHKKP